MIIQGADRLSSVEEYYFSKKLKEIRNLNLEGRDIINLGIGSPDMPPSDEVIETLSSEAQQETNHGYQSYVGIPELRKAISGYLSSQYQIDYSAENEILPLIGSKEGIMHISMAFLNEGDKVLVPNPGYPTYSSVSKLVGAEIVTYELSETNSWKLNFDSLEQLPLSEVKLMWVNYPNMPTGQKGDMQDFARLIELAKKHKFLIINDNPYGQLYEGEQLSILQAQGAKEVCLELNSLSKSHNMAGWRVGWIVGDSSYISTILKVKSNMDSGMFKPLQLAAVKALNSDHKWFESLKNSYQERRTLAFQIMDILNCTYEKYQGGMFVWAKIPDAIESVESWIDQIILEAEVFITPGFIFGSKGERYIRISLCSNLDILGEALERINQWKK
ncbi:MAG: aminotransferase class I/II-fold pyridoxal phosphate-dependent enzyme [bacterium]|nr:aminotransferase class I/II-fold pyridoxal phosphate-dependent enzyme [bacterium]